MKKVVTFRFDQKLLQAAKKTATQQNRTLTNFLETVLIRALAEEDVAPLIPSERQEDFPS